MTFKIPVTRLRFPSNNIPESTIEQKLDPIFMQVEYDMGRLLPIFLPLGHCTEDPIDEGLLLVIIISTVTVHFVCVISRLKIQTISSSLTQG